VSAGGIGLSRSTRPRPSQVLYATESAVAGSAAQACRHVCLEARRHSFALARLEYTAFILRYMYAMRAVMKIVAAPCRVLRLFEWLLYCCPERHAGAAPRADAGAPVAAALQRVFA